MASSLRVVFANTLAALGILVACGGEARAQGKPVDVTKFDIGGIRLFMSADEAAAALKQHYGANIKIEVLKYSSEYNPPAEYVREITYQEGPYRLNAQFTEKFPPANTHREAVTSISYYSSGTDADQRQFWTSVKEKYGPVSFGSADTPLSWCAKFNRYGGCDNSEAPTMKGENSGHTFGLLLYDQTYANKMRQAYEQSTTTAKPKF